MWRDVVVFIVGRRHQRSTPLAMLKLTMKKELSTHACGSVPIVMVLRLAFQLRSLFYQNIIVARKTCRFCITRKGRYFEIFKWIKYLSRFM